MDFQASDGVWCISRHLKRLFDQRKGVTELKQAAQVTMTSSSKRIEDIWSLRCSRRAREVVQ